jgi:hypothetical protein
MVSITQVGRQGLKAFINLFQALPASIIFLLAHSRFLLLASSLMSIPPPEWTLVLFHTYTERRVSYVEGIRVWKPVKLHSRSWPPRRGIVRDKEKDSKSTALPDSWFGNTPKPAQGNPYALSQTTLLSQVFSLLGLAYVHDSQNSKFYLGTVAHTCNPSYAGGLWFEASLCKKLSETSSQQINQAWWCMPVIPAMWEATGRMILLQAGSLAKTWESI